MEQTRSLFSTRNSDVAFNHNTSVTSGVLHRQVSLAAVNQICVTFIKEINSIFEMFMES